MSKGAAAHIRGVADKEVARVVLGLGAAREEDAPTWAWPSTITKPKLAQTGDATPSFVDCGAHRRNLEVRPDPLERGRDKLSIKYSWTSNGLRM